MFYRCHSCLVALLLLSACGGDEPEPSTPPDQTTTPVPGDDDTSAGDDDGTGSTPGPTVTAMPEPTPEPGTPTPGPTPGIEPTPTAAPTPSPTPPPPEYALGSPVEVLYDQSGVPHIYAQTLEDAFWTQGWVEARDRLWQMDFNRRTARGRLAEILGPAYVPSDTIALTMNFNGLAVETYQDIQETDPELASLLDAFSAGVNAYRAAALEQRDGAALPPQILALDYIPDPWYPTDTLAIEKAITYDMSCTADIELTIGVISGTLDPGVTSDLLRPQPIEDTVIVPGFYDDMRTQASARVARKLDLGLSLDDLVRYLRTRSPLGLPRFQGGSNNWVVSGANTASGYPILANDTHRGVDAPATYYQVHLCAGDDCDDVDVMGYTFAGTPGVIIGNNRWAAWGATNNFADVTDLYLEEVRGDKVLFENDWVDTEVRMETIRVRQPGKSVAEAEEQVLVVRTVPHHGPILPRDLVGDLPLTVSVRWVGNRAGTMLRTFLALARGRSVEDFHDALQYLYAGAQNWVFANVDGDIAYWAPTDIPVREQLDPDYPPYSLLPGSGGYEWTGDFVARDMIPGAVNPAAGFIVSANNDPAGNVQDNDVFNDPVYLGALYDLGSRAARITALLEEAVGTQTLSLDEMAEIQGDVFMQYATHFVPYVLEAADARPDLVTGNLATAVDLLRNWDYRATADSPETLLFHAWIPFLLRHVFADETTEALFDDLGPDYVNMLSRPLAHFLDKTREDIAEIEAGTVPFPSVSGLNYFDDQTTDSLETRDEVLLKSLADAADLLQARHGDATTWSWASNHLLSFNDPAEAFLSDASTGPFPVDGGYFTVDVAEFPLTSGGEVSLVFDVTNAPSQRTLYLLDPAGVTVLDILPGGQSERPGDAHFNDQVTQYLENTYRTRPFRRQDVETAQTARVVFSVDGAVSWQ